MSIEEQISSLNRKEITVLYWKCKGLQYGQIAVRYGKTIKWAQFHMSNVYVKLGFDKTMHSTKRWEILEENVCPVVMRLIGDNTQNLEKWVPKLEENGEVRVLPEPVEVPKSEFRPDQEMFALVVSDELELQAKKSKALLPPKPKETIIIKERTKGMKTFSLFVFALAAAVILSLLGMFVYNLGRGATPEPQIVIITVTPIPATDTPVPTATSEIPTETPTTVPTNTQVPTNTPVPTEFIPPADGVLFQDNFETGDLSAWDQVNGQWLVSNGQLTPLGDDNDSYKWISLKRPEWKNYVLSLTVYQPCQGCAAQSDLLVTVRNNGSQSKYIGVPVDNFGKVYWAFIGSNMFDNDVIAGNKFENSFESGSNMELEMQGDTYILRVNGREVQRITIAGYSSGGISLGADCNTGDNCAKFDNVKVTYLP